VTHTATPAVDSESEPTSPVRSSARFSRSRYFPALVLLLLMGFSLLAHLGALRQDLPLPDGDETFFVKPAVSFAATGDPNPHWFGHPGSTVIYPVAVLIHLWDATAHNGPIFGSHAELRQRFASDPRPFYLIARLWTIALAVATIPALFALGLRAFNRRVGLIAATLWSVLPGVIHYGRIARTESAATFFGVTTLYFCVRAWQHPRRRWWILAGLGVGLAVSSRYSMAALAPCVIAAAVIPVSRERRLAVRAAGTAAAAGVVGFVLTSPYVLLDLSVARHDLTSEATVSHTVASGLSPVGNALWYVRDAIPGVLTWPLYVAAVLGLLLVVIRRSACTSILVAFCAIYFVAISASSLHWERWAIEMLPLLVLFGAAATDELAHIVARAVRSPGAGIAVAAVVTVSLVVSPILDIQRTNRYDSAASTSRLAREWMEATIPPGSRVEQLAATIGIPSASIPPIGHGIEIDYQLDDARPLSYYRGRRVDYVVTGVGTAFSYLSNSRRYPKQARFYQQVACKTRLVAQFDRSNSRAGLGIRIYRLDLKPVKLLDLFCNQAVAPSR
jgi:hypothetical protein